MLEAGQLGKQMEMVSTLRFWNMEYTGGRGMWLGRTKLGQKGTTSPCMEEMNV